MKRAGQVLTAAVGVPLAWAPAVAKTEGEGQSEEATSPRQTELGYVEMDTQVKGNTRKAKEKETTESGEEGA